ncbi:DUF4012 domain-containing protein [Herbiconiux sp. CPCC 203407]|uniref:DUF4012 domain-containing protein n=1 Tax=Herbiconiux oxytropis TaxID=2970915 RepID=A0AA42BVD4_9MICO|nr:DUF4012 domain-containing protein [Herbiconiux oxytropis]MCS5723257.1 DUF4012 domain-containing protein [Herbiconiux oxytropis]MCS5727912.1 DUF4012 domain-containing protein [Herbiconiux oxytropis]
MDHARQAADLTGDPVWRLGEFVPFAGPNLAAVRQAASITDSVASDAIYPLVSNVSDIGVDSFQPVNGAIDLAPLVAAQPTVATARTVLSSAAADARGIETDGTVDLISEAVGKLRDSVIEADGLIQGVDRAVTLIPRMLGAEGDRNYLLLFQNPAELRSGGGITSALAQISTTAGSVSLTQQASGSDFRYADPVLPLPPESLALYGDRAARYVQNTTLVPQFELSGQIAATMWADRFGVQTDGAIAFDPVALSYLLEATGPITLPTSGVELTSENAVQFLLSDVYAQFEEPSVQDAVFAEAAKAVFDRVSSGDLDAGKLVSALTQAGDEGRFKIWSSHPEDQAVLADTTLAGGLPISGPNSSGVGVYLNDGTGAKMDYYLDTAVAVQGTSCRADGRPTVRVEVTLTSTAPADAGAVLPAYVTGGGNFGVTPGNVKTIVFVYGPDGANPDEPVLITDVDPGLEGAEFFSGRDQNRLVAGFPIELAPGETRTVAAEFVAQTGSSADFFADITPGVHPTVYSTETRGGFAGCEFG